MHFKPVADNTISVRLDSHSKLSQPVLLTNPKTLLALAVILSTCWFHERLLAVNIPKSLYIFTLSKG